MTFINPILAAVGIGCIAIPIIIHILMRRRRRPVPWAAMKFLLEAYRRQRQRVNLEQILLLAARCLLVALLALALGKPILGAAGALGPRGPRTLFVVIDNSLTSTALTGAGDDTTALDGLKASALDLLGTLDSTRGDRAAVLTLAGPPDAPVLPPSVDLAATMDIVRGVTGADSRADFAAAFARIRDELRRDASLSGAGSTVVIALVSEFRAGSADLEVSVPSIPLGGAKLVLIAAQPATLDIDNIGIERVEPAQSVVLAQQGGSVAPVRVLVRRSGPGTTQAATTKITVEAIASGDRTGPRPARGEATVSWSPGQETAEAFASVTLPEPDSAGTRTPLVLRANIDRDAITGDNTFRRPIDTRDRLEVAILSPGSLGNGGTVGSFSAAEWLALSLSPETDLGARRRQNGEIRVTLIDPARIAGADAGLLRDTDAIFAPRPDLIDAGAWRSIRSAVDRGCLLLVSPPAGAQTHVWSDEMTQGLGLPWTISREARDLTPAMGISPDRGTPDIDLLEPLAAEFAALVRPVQVSRVLPVETTGSATPLMTLSDGTPLLLLGQSAGEGSASRDSRGLVLFLAAAPDLAWTDLPTKPFMVPLMQELIRQGVGRALGPRTALAGVTPPLPAGAAEMVPVALPDDPAEGEAPASVSIGAGGVPTASFRHAGVWRVRTLAGNSLGLIAYNADALAGQTRTQTQADLARWLSPVSNDIVWLTGDPETPASNGDVAEAYEAALSVDSDLPPVSFPLLLAAAAIAALECFLAKVFSHARADAAPGLARPLPSAGGKTDGAAA
jgi:hypothetical protein